MLQLTTLGSLELTRADGTPAAELLRQPKRVALLVYLAARRSQAPIQRELLRGMFWAERTEDRARRALNQALYGMRTALGDGVIESHGANGVSVNPGSLQCDVAAFERAMNNGSLTEALAQYQGDFLPGFSIPLAPEFERWVESSRSRLRRRAAEAAASLCVTAQANGDRSEAIRWGRLRLALAPTDEIALRGFLTVLVAAGDQAEAAEVYYGFARTLASDLEAKPSPESEALFWSIVQRAGPTDGVEGRPRKDLAPPVRPAVASSPRERHGWLGRVVPVALAASILGSVWIATGDGNRQTVGRAGPQDPATATYLSRIGRFFWSQRTDASLRTSVDFFSRAVIADPHYAPALSGLADAYTLQAWYGDAVSPTAPGAARVAALAAVRFGDTLAESHTSLAGVHAWFDRDWRTAETEFRRAIALDSTYPTAHQWYAFGLAARGRIDEALREMQAAQRHDPISPSIAMDLAMMLFWSGRDTQALGVVRYALKLDPGHPRASLAMWRLYTDLGRGDEAVTALQRVITDRGGTRRDAARLRQEYAQHGLRGALKWWARLLEHSPSASDRPMRLAILYGLLDQRVDAMRWLRAAKAAGTPLLQLAVVDPAFRALRNDPEFERLVAS